MFYELSDNTWDKEEIFAIEEVIESKNFTMGEKVKLFEAKFAKKMGTEYAIMVNSGSSANLLAVAALVYSGRIQRGDEVIVPAVSWSTTYAPLQQYGLKVKFVDIDKETLNIDIEQLKKAVTRQTKMVFLVNLLGNPNEFNKITDILKDTIVIEDNCESLGAQYSDKYLGTLGLMGTYSFFYSHHICTMEGGVVTTDDEELYHYMLSVRAHGWTRNLPKNSKIYHQSSDSFYESFNFIMPGYNLRPLEIEAALGITQLEKMDNIISQRRQNAEYFKSRFGNISGFRLQKEIGKSSWFGFSVVLEDSYKEKRRDVVQALQKADIAVRPIVAGNFTKNKAIQFFDYEIFGSLINADEIHHNGFFVGNHSIDNSNQIDYLFETLHKEFNLVDGK